MTTQHTPHTPPMWRQVISLPHTRLGKWAIGLAAGSVSLFLWAYLFFGEEIGPVTLNVILVIMLLVVSLASGVVGSLALGAGERSLLVWLAQVPTALIFFILPNLFQEGSPWGRGSVGVLVWAVFAFGLIYLSQWVHSRRSGAIGSRGRSSHTRLGKWAIGLSVGSGLLIFGLFLTLFLGVEVSPWTWMILIAGILAGAVLGLIALLRSP